MGSVQSAQLPDVDAPPTFDKFKGFPNGRKEKVMPLTPDEMASAKIPLEMRDYCAHKYVDYHVCVRKNFPFSWRCGHERHAYQTCEYEDEISRFMEYERERRLIAREAKKKRRDQKLAEQEALGE